MFGLTWGNFFRAAVAGFAATFVMEMVGFWQPGFKLARVDGAKMLADSARRHWVYGEFAHYMTGIALAVTYARWFERRVHGPGFFKGLCFGILNGLAADGLVTPVIDQRLGPFFLNTPRPYRLGLASMLDHVVFGITLGLGYESPKGQEQQESS